MLSHGILCPDMLYSGMFEPGMPSPSGSKLTIFSDRLESELHICLDRFKLGPVVCLGSNEIRDAGGIWIDSECHSLLVV
jgi:hypothetical protein